MKITAKVTDKNPVHSRLSVWVDGGLIVNPGGICLRNEEVEEFLNHLTISSRQIKAKVRMMIEDYKEQDGLMGSETFEKQVVLQVVLNYIEQEERKMDPKIDGWWEVKDAG